MTITALPSAPLPTDNTATFNSKAFALVAALNTFVTEANATGSAANADAITATAKAIQAINAEASAVAAANFKGAWSVLTGALAIPASVSHLNKVWVLTESVANVTTEVPGTSAKWLAVSVNFDSPGVIGGVTPAAATFTNLSYNGTLNGGTGVINIGSGQFYKDAAGNFGFGITPSAWNSSLRSLDLGNFGSYFSAGTTAYSGSGIMFLGNNAYLTAGSNWVYRQTAPSVQYRQSAGEHQWHIAPSGTAGNPITFTQAATLDVNGTFLVGTTAANPVSARVNGFAVNNNGRAACRSTVGWDWGISGTSGTHVQFYTDNGSTYVSAGLISSSGSTTNYTSPSDYRLKNIAGALTTSGSFIDALEPVVGTWKLDGSPFVGFLAHKFQEVSPSSVTGKKDEVDAEGNPIYQAMQASTTEVMANIVAELQSLRKRVAVLEAV